jgi:hypothetical protein
MSLCRGSLNSTKFHRGFHRRMVMDVNDARNAILEGVYRRREQRFQDSLQRYRERSENIVLGPVIREIPASRRKFIRPDLYDDSRIKEDRTRLANGPFRFYSIDRPYSPCASIKNRSQIILF